MLKLHAIMNGRAIYTSSTSQNICFGGTTSWIVKAKTLQDKTKALKQIKKDIQKIIK